MAIKGKKKSQTRGSQARRRPASAPRPTYAARAHEPWHRTPGGQVTLGVVLALLFGLGSWAFLAARSNAREADEQRAQLERYTSDLRGLVQALNGPVGEMSAIPLEPTPEVVEDLATAPDAWTQQLTKADETTLQINPPAEVSAVHPLFSRMVALYSSAAGTYSLVPGADGRLQARLMRSAGEVRDHATGLFFAAVALLDAARLELDMGSSRLEPPQPPAPTAQPVPTPLLSVPVEAVPDEGGDGAGGGNGGGAGGGKKAGRKN